MEEMSINTNLGSISVSIDNRSSNTSVVFLHGVFLDKSLWSDVAKDLPEVTRVYIDMPAHGKSSNVDRDWSLDNCVEMLMEIIDELKIETCILIGHSWGSMTALRAATKYPDSFRALVLLNMPFKKTLGIRRIGFMLQKLMLFFPKFYAAQAAKSLYSNETLLKRPELIKDMQDRLSQRTAKELSRVIDAVILAPDDASKLITQLQVPAVAVIGEEDYVGKHESLETWTVSGGHISPHEAVTNVKEAIIKVLGINAVSEC